MPIFHGKLEGSANEDFDASAGARIEPFTDANGIDESRACMKDDLLGELIPFLEKVEEIAFKLKLLREFELPKGTQQPIQADHGVQGPYTDPPNDGPVV